MAVVTYLPRFIPFLVLRNREVNTRVRRFLYYIPYTSLSILIIRGIITVDSGMKLATILGVGTTGALAYIKNNLILAVGVGILLAFFVLV